MRTLRLHTKRALQCWMQSGLMRGLMGAQAHQPRHRPTHPLALGGCGLVALYLASSLAIPLAFAKESTENPSFTTHRFALEYEFGSMVALDLEKDGQAEMLVLEVEYHPDRSYTHHPRLFKRQQGKNAKTWQVQNATKTPLPKQVLFMDAGHTAYGPSLVFATPGELHLWAWQEGWFQPAARIRLSELRGPPLQVPARHLALLQDLSGDGLAEVVLPLADGVQVIRVLGEQGGLVLHTRIKGASYTTLYAGTPSNQWIHWVRWPKVVLVDVDKVGWRDILLFNDGVIVIQPLDAQGQPSTNMRQAFDLQPVEPFDPKKQKRPYINLARAGDLNGDGLLDLLVYKIARGKKAFDSRMSTAVYYGHTTNAKPLAFSSIPEQVFVSQGVGFPILNDFNGDGLDDLVVVQVDIGFWDLVKGFIAREYSGEALYRLMGKNGRYARSPTAVRQYDVGLSFTHQPTILFADLNGDGHKELLLSKATDTLGIHWGKKQGFWAEEPEMEWSGVLPSRSQHIFLPSLQIQQKTQSLLFAYDRNDARLEAKVYRQLLIVEYRAKP